MSHFGYLKELPWFREDVIIRGLLQSVHLPQHPQALKSFETVRANLRTIINVWMRA